MKKLTAKLSKSVAKTALSMGLKSSEAACTYWFHQPVVPQGMDKFKK